MYRQIVHQREILLPTQGFSGNTYLVPLGFIENLVYGGCSVEMHGVYAFIAVLSFISAAISVYIAYRLWRVGSLIGDRALEIVSIGYIALAVGLIVSFIASAVALAHPAPRLWHGYTHHAWRHEGSPHYGFGGGYPPPWCGYVFERSWVLVLASSIVYPVAYIIMLIGLRREHVESSGLSEPLGGASGSRALWSIASASPLSLQALGFIGAAGLVGDAVSVVVLILINASLHTSSKTARAGYLLLLSSHAIRLASIILGSPIVFLAGEAVRPLGLLAIGLSLVGRR